MRRRLHRFVLAAAVLPVALAGCGHHSATAKPKLASDSPAATTSARAARQLTDGDVTVRGALVADTAHRPVLDAYLAFWKAYVQASATDNADSPALRASMTAAGFTGVRGTLSSAAAAGLTQKGPIVLNPRLDITRNAAVRIIDDCVDLSKVKVYKNGQDSQPGPAAPQPFVARLEPGGAGYLVASLDLQSTGCS
ncbi:MAG: hypothetical protein ACJ73S_25825 [Mycobacteriales bacterium]